MTEAPSIDSLVGYLWRLHEIEEFHDKTYLPTLYTVARYYQEFFGIGTGCKNLLSYGVYPLNDEETEFLFKPGVYTEGVDGPFDVEKINEYVKHSWYDDKISGLNPKAGQTIPQLEKSKGYSFAKAPGYNGKPHEVGPMARMWIANPVITKHANRFLNLPAGKEVRFRDLGKKAFSVLGRLVARAEEGWIEIQAMKRWVTQIKPGEPVYVKTEVPESGVGYGLAEAPRGSVGHWIRISDRKISNYQVIAPTSWNISPRDDNGVPGPIEQALIGTPVRDPANPVNVMRVIHSFDP